MKTLILYATKHGATRDIAQRLAARMDGAQTFDLGGGNAPAPEGYDRVIIGSAVYAGQLRKPAKAYVSQHADALRRVPLGLFVSGMQPDGAKEHVNANYPKDVCDHARAVAMLGGAFDPAHAGFFERLLMRMIAKTPDALNTVSEEKIGQFAQAMQE